MSLERLLGDGVLVRAWLSSCIILVPTSLLEGVIPSLLNRRISISGLIRWNVINVSKEDHARSLVTSFVNRLHPGHRCLETLGECVVESILLR